MDNIERDNSVIYELYSVIYGKLVIDEPKGWSNDVESYKRDKDSRAITSKIDIDLEFYGEASSYLTNIYFSLGIEQKVLLTKYEKNVSSLSEEWEIRYVQELDMNTYKHNERTGSVKVNSVEGGLYSDIVNRKGDVYDIIDPLSADEIDLGELTTNVFQPVGRSFLIESLLESEETGYRVNSRSHDALSDGTFSTSRAVPFNVTTFNSLKGDVVPPLNGVEGYNTFAGSDAINVGQNIDIGDLCFYQAETDMYLDINFNIDYKVTKSKEGGNTDARSFGVRMVVTEPNATSDRIIKVLDLPGFFNPSNEVNKAQNASFADSNYQLLKGQSFGFIFLSTYYYDGWFADGFMYVYTNITNGVFSVTDLTNHHEVVSVNKCVKPLDLFDRLVAKITGKQGLVKSSIFEDGGEYEFMVIDNGLLARGFPTHYKNAAGEDQSIQLKMSFKDAFESYSYIEPLCWFIEVIGTTEYVRIETAKYTQGNFIGITLGDVDNIMYESSKADTFSNVRLGHNRSLILEEVNGLDEPNGRSDFTTFITKADSKYDFTSKFRTDAIPYEITRRLPYEEFPKTDTKRDDDIWLHDAKEISAGVITHKTWQERFDTIPTGIYDANTSWNLWLSPMNRLVYGHGYSIIRGLYHYPNKKINFISSNANQNLTTVHNGLELKENGSIPISAFPEARVEATMVECTFNMTQELQDAFKGSKDVNGVIIPRVFGLVEYNEKGVKKYGRLTSLASSEEAKITLIKARI